MKTKTPSISRRLQFLLVAGASSIALLAVACGGDDAPADPLPDNDAAVADATNDVTTTVDGSRPDGATTDARSDATTDATTDGGDASTTDARTDAGDAAGDGSTTTDAGDGSTTADGGTGTVADFILDQINNHTNDTDLPSTRPFDTPDPFTDSEDQAPYAPLF